MNRLIRGILYVVAGCAGMGAAALILGVMLGRGQLSRMDYGILNFAKNTAYNIVSNVENRLKNWLEWDRSLVSVQVQEKSDIKKGEYSLLSVSADQVDVLDIQLRYGSLEITSSDTGNIWISADQNISGISVINENGEIVIKDSRSGTTGYEDLSLYMTVPESWQASKISIHVGDGEVYMEDGIWAETISLYADAGTINAGELECVELSAQVGAGTLRMEESTIMGNVRLDCGIGEIGLNDTTLEGDVEISCGMGTIDLSGDDVDYKNKVNYVLRCGMGEIEIGGDSYSSPGQEKRIDNDAPHTFTLDCGMGTITID